MAINVALNQLITIYNVLAQMNQVNLEADTDERTMFKQVILLIVFFLLTGCSHFIAKPYNERITQTTVVTWTTVDNIDETCRSMGSADPGLFRRINGCVEYTRYTCRIFTAKITSMEILGHELRHCFEGKFHN